MKNIEDSVFYFFLNNFLAFCFFSYLLVSIGHRTVPKSILIDINNVGKAWVILPPLLIVLLSVSKPVLKDVNPIVSDGPNINANGTARGAERIVYNTGDYKVYYTADHYNTFKEV